MGYARYGCSPFAAAVPNQRRDGEAWWSFGVWRGDSKVGVHRHIRDGVVGAIVSSDDDISSKKIGSDPHLEALAQQITLIGRNGEDLTLVYDGGAGLLVARGFPTRRGSREAAVTISGNAMTVNGEPVNLFRDGMAAGIGGHVLVVIRPKNIADHSNFRDVGPFPFRQVLALACNEV